MSLGLQDLDDAVEDQRHLGWGYSTKSGLPNRAQATLDCAVIDVANELELNYEELFHWTNSKYGRWLVDTIGGKTPTKAAVRKYLNAEAVKDAQEGVA